MIPAGPKRNAGQSKGQMWLASGCEVQDECGSSPSFCDVFDLIVQSCSDWNWTAVLYVSRSDKGFVHNILNTPHHIVSLSSALCQPEQGTECPHQHLRYLNLRLRFLWKLSVDDMQGFAPCRTRQSDQCLWYRGWFYIIVHLKMIWKQLQPHWDLVVKHALARWVPKAFHYTCTVCINKCSLVLGCIMRLFHKDR